MTNTQFSVLILVLFLLLAGLALTLIGVLTDYWYFVETTSESVNKTVSENWNYNYGLWRKCYDRIPEDVLKDGAGSCVTTYQDLIKWRENDLSYDDSLYLHLSRTVVGCAVAMGGVQLAALFSLLCGSWPGNCRAVRKGRLYWGTAMILLLATMCGIASGISFIALRDLDKKDTYNTYPPDVEVAGSYGWSFMVTWIATGLDIVDGFILLILMKFSYDDVNEIQKNYYYNMKDSF